MVKEKRHVI